MRTPYPKISLKGSDDHEKSRVLWSRTDVLEILERGKGKFIVDRRYTLKAFAASKSISPLIFRMYWTILTAPQRCYFFTSDNPVVYGSPKQHPISGDGGLSNKNVEVTFPINKKKLLLATWGDPETKDDMPEPVVKLVNAQTISQAFRFVYGPIEEDWIKQYAQHTIGGHRRLANEDLPEVTVGRGPKR